MTEHLLVFPEREVADAVADGLDRHVYVVRVLRETLAGEDDADAAQWLVDVVDERDLSAAESAAERLRLTDLARDNGGWYDDTEVTEGIDDTGVTAGDEGAGHEPEADGEQAEGGEQVADGAEGGGFVRGPEAGD